MTDAYGLAKEIGNTNPQLTRRKFEYRIDVPSILPNQGHMRLAVANAKRRKLYEARKSGSQQ